MTNSETFPKNHALPARTLRTRNTGDYFTVATEYPDRNSPKPVLPRPIVPPPALLTAPIGDRNAKPSKLLGFKMVELDLSATFTARKIDISGNVLWINYSTNATDRIKIKINGESDFLSATRGWFVAGCAFDQVVITNPDAVADATLELAYAYDPGEQEIRIM